MCCTREEVGMLGPREADAMLEKRSRKRSRVKLAHVVDLARV